MRESWLFKRLPTPEEKADISLQFRISDYGIPFDEPYRMCMPDLGCRFWKIFFYLVSENFTDALIAWLEVRLVVEDVGWSCHIFLAITDFYAESSRREPFHIHNIHTVIHRSWIFFSFFFPVSHDFRVDLVAVLFRSIFDIGEPNRFIVFQIHELWKWQSSHASHIGRKILSHTFSVRESSGFHPYIASILCHFFVLFDFIFRDHEDIGIDIGCFHKEKMRK